MDDSQIVSLYWERNEQAISETDHKYRSYCYVIANNILQNAEDSEETLSDTYLHAWNGIPPNRPKELRTFLGKISRRLAIDKWRRRSAAKRSCEVMLALDELADCLPDSHSVDESVRAEVLAGLISSFLWALPNTQRQLFVRRYWYVDPISALSHEFGFSQSKVTSMLYQVRKKLLNYLEERWDFNET